jgi:drug/metabolite transporter (DMT)-like permease
MGLYLAIDKLPLSLAITIYYTQPILVALLCYCFLGEKLTRLEVLSIFSAMFGVVLLT